MTQPLLVLFCLFNTKLNLNLVQSIILIKRVNSMHLSQDIKPISYLKAKTAEVINSVNENQRTIIITQNGEAKAVVQDIKSYENLQNSLNLLKLIVQSENDIENNDVIKQDKMFENLENKLFG
jgi:prevent-host-death family protein